MQTAANLQRPCSSTALMAVSRHPPYPETPTSAIRIIGGGMKEWGRDEWRTVPCLCWFAAGDNKKGGAEED